MNQQLTTKILNYIEHHICEKISLADLANLAGYSPFYFSTLFTEIMGIPVTSYIRIRKLQYAMSDLLANEKITDVAFKYSFESHEGFTRSFTKFFGSSPSTVKKHVASYNIPDYVVPKNIHRKETYEMKNNCSLKEDMYKIPFTFLAESLKEWESGNCTHITMELLPDNTLRIQDNGRGIPLGDFPTIDLQTANSLCEKLQLTVYRNGNKYVQNYVRGIPQHNVICEVSNLPSGTEVILKPDTEVFGELTFKECDVTILKNK